MRVNFFSKSTNCWKNHSTQGISQVGTETYSKVIFYCEDCNKVRVLRFWNPRILSILRQLKTLISSFIHQENIDDIPF